VEEFFKCAITKSEAKTKFKKEEKPKTKKFKEEHFYDWNNPYTVLRTHGYGLC